MTQRTAFRLVLTLVMAAFLTGTLGSAAWAGQKKKKDTTIPFSRTEIFIEFNSTDEDTGIQALLDGEAWNDVEITAPDGRRIFDVKSKARSRSKRKGALKELGITELFFESQEPGLDTLPLDEFLVFFPQGEYRFSGRTVDGKRLTGQATLTHVIPAGPEIVSPEEGEAVDPDDAFIEWEPVTEPPGVRITGYQVIVVQESPLRTLIVDLPADATSLLVPPEFFDPNVTEYKFEVLAREVSGNQTITEQEFETD